MCIAYVTTNLLQQYAHKLTIDKQSAEVSWQPTVLLADPLHLGCC